MNVLEEIELESRWNDKTAINRHKERWYKDCTGQLYILSRTLDVCPPFFEAYGPFKQRYEGLLPRLRVNGKEYWGNGLTWNQTIQALCAELGAIVIRRRKHHVIQM